MEHAPPNREDHFSNIPEDILLHILSLLPTKLAARTSLLSCRFRHLWEICPALEINSSYFEHRPSDLDDFVNRTLLQRRGDPPSALHSLCLRLFPAHRHANLLTSSYISSLLDKAASLGLCHLTVSLHGEILATVLPSILSVSSLESLSLYDLRRFPKNPFIFSPVTLTNLKTLYISTSFLRNDELNWLLPQLNVLEDLNLSWLCETDDIELKLKTVKRLMLVISCNDLIISAPSLEFFQFRANFSRVLRNFHGDMPLLRKAIMSFDQVYVHNVPAICQVLRVVSHVEELQLDITEHWYQKDIFHALLVNSVDPPIFVRLKHFHLEICFHEFNMEDLVTIIQHSPSLESLKLVHKPPSGFGKNNISLWKSMLPRNGEGSHEHAYFKDLHITKKKDGLLRKLKQSSKGGKA